MKLDVRCNYHFYLKDSYLGTLNGKEGTYSCYKLLHEKEYEGGLKGLCQFARIYYHAPNENIYSFSEYGTVYIYKKSKLLSGDWKEKSGFVNKDCGIREIFLLNQTMRLKKQNLEKLNNDQK